MPCSPPSSPLHAHPLLLTPPLPPPPCYRYKDAISAFVTILDVYYKHLDALRQRHQQDRAQAAAGGTPPKPADYVSSSTHIP